MELLPDGKVRIKNSQSGETRDIDPVDLHQYGANLTDQYKALKTQPSQQPQQAVSPISQVSNNPEQEVKKSLGGFLGNVVKSGGNVVKDLGSAAINVLNPDMNKNTLANIAKVGIGAGELLIPGEQGSEKYAKNVGSFYNDRYGISDVAKGDLESAKKKVINTLYNDPTGAALDIATILSGGGGAVAKAGELSKIEGIAKAGTTAAKLGEAIDPLRAAGKAAGLAKAKTADILPVIGEKVENLGKESSIKALRASPSQVTNFEKTVKKPLGDFISENSLQGSGKVAAQKAEKLIKPLQDEYNSLVKTGAEIPTKTYADNLRSRAKEIMDSDRSESARQVAQKLIDEASAQEKLGKTISDTVLTKTKTSSYGKVPGSVVTDPIALNAQKEIGQVGIQTLDQVAPGSSTIGTKLRDLREFKKIATKQSGIGKGTQLFNMIKPSGTGAILGGVVGGIPGAVTGAVASNLLNSPASISALSRGAEKAGQIMQNLPDINVPSGAVNAAENARLVVAQGNNGNNYNNTDQSQDHPGILPQVSPMSNPSDQLPDINQETPQTLNPYGATPEILYREYQNALNAGDNRTASQIRQMYSDEVAYQKQRSSTGKPKSAAGLQVEGKAKAGINALDTIESAIAADPNILIKAAIPGSPGARQFEASLSSLTDAIGGLRTGATVSKEQLKFYRSMLPKIGDSPETINKKLQDLRTELSSYVTGSGSIQDAPTADTLPNIE